MHRNWVPVYLGKADNLQQRLGAYLHADETFGPSGEGSGYKYRAMVDLQRRGFAIQIR